MKLDPTKLADWQIAEAAEANMKSVSQLAAELGLHAAELIPIGRQLAKIDQRHLRERLVNSPQGKYINVTAITPTPLGEGKTTTTIGLVQALGRRGHRVTGAIRQPSGGPTFNIKGSAAGGGLAQCIPLTPFSMGLTGDIDRIVNAHNLSMVALTARMQHELNYDDEALAKRNLRRLDIDPARVQSRWVMDFCAQALRNITIGKGGKMDGYEMDSGFAIAVSSELMAILAVADSLADMRERIGRIVMAHSRSGKPVTTSDLEVAGAMCAWMVDALDPTLAQTLEGQPVLVHAGPFANIAIGQSSVIADQIGTRLSDYHVTESGFGADIGYEKFWNLKCRYSGLRPDAVVIVATIRALKMHGGGPEVKPGLKLAEVYTQENLGLLEQGCENLLAHIETVQKSGVRPVVCINSFYTDTAAEVALVKRLAEQAGAYAACSEHWLKG
ncbi:MAG: formate--tetrahydrofolate ligase, partial [Lentisphaerae bacterium]|nr:formate--tetrahydrofolate ligase [Lentisphaerota bacterium]